MYKEKVKNVILVGLIVLCIIQTAMLWLGDSSGLNFLSKNQSISKLSPIYPEATWVTLGEGTLAYQIESTTEYTSRQYQRLVSELQNIIVEKVKPEEFKIIPYLNWGEMLSLKGIWYEYAIPITIDEMAGSYNDRYKEFGMIDHVFLRMSDTTGLSAQIFLINSADEKVYQANIKSDLKDLFKIVEVFGSEKTGKAVTYQATITSNVRDFVERNTFVPATVPLEYELLPIYNPIVGDESQRVGQLEEYMDSFFDNPLLKTVDARSDGSIVLSEKMKTMMIYKPNGTMEYANLNATRNGEKMTRIEGYNLAIEFLRENNGIPMSVRKHLYLTDIEQTDTEYSYIFDMIYEGYKVKLSPKLQRELGMEHFVKITVKNNQVISAKWALFEIGRDASDFNDVKGILIDGYVEPLNKMIEYGQMTTSSMVTFETVESVYLMESLDGYMRLQWGVTLDDTWYYPNK